MRFEHPRIAAEAFRKLGCLLLDFGKEFVQFLEHFVKLSCRHLQSRAVKVNLRKRTRCNVPHLEFCGVFDDFLHCRLAVCLNRILERLHTLRCPCAYREKLNIVNAHQLADQRSAVCEILFEVGSVN